MDNSDMYAQELSKMWKATAREIEADITMYTISDGDRVLNFREVINLFQTSFEFIHFWIDILRTSPYEAFFWEVRPVSIKILDNAFEFVLVRSTILQTIKADITAFEKYFQDDSLVVCFPNLGGDAKLIVPTPRSNTNYYTHLATFVRNGPLDQVEKFWQIVGQQYGEAIGEQVKWLSTAGLGIYWLHVRIDSKPKYYRYTPYKAIN